MDLMAKYLVRNSAPGRIVFVAAAASVTVAAERPCNPLGFQRHGGRGAPQVAAALLRHPGRQMAGAGMPVHRLAFGRKAKTLLGGFVGFLLGHIKTVVRGQLTAFDDHEIATYRWHFMIMKLQSLAFQDHEIVTYRCPQQAKIVIIGRRPFFGRGIRHGKPTGPQPLKTHLSSSRGVAAFPCINSPTRKILPAA
jgi:hypothetical protein